MKKRQNSKLAQMPNVYPYRPYFNDLSTTSIYKMKDYILYCKMDIIETASVFTLPLIENWLTYYITIFMCLVLSWFFFWPYTVSFILIPSTFFKIKIWRICREKKTFSFIYLWRSNSPIPYPASLFLKSDVYRREEGAISMKHTVSPIVGNL